MAISALPEQGEPAFEIGDDCASIVKSGTGTSAGVHCVGSGRNGCLLGGLMRKTLCGMGVNTERGARKQQSCGRSESTLYGRTENFVRAVNIVSEKTAIKTRSDIRPQRAREINTRAQ